jgi:hypothetical protein
MGKEDTYEWAGLRDDDREYAVISDLLLVKGAERFCCDDAGEMLMS